MATAEKSSPTSTKSLLPPEERFWKHYSPHFELPLAGATAIFTHGLIVGILAIGGLAFLFRGGVEASRPPQMDIVALDDSGGSPGGSPGMPGLPGEGGKTENPDSNSAEGGDPLPSATPDIPDLPQVETNPLEFTPAPTPALPEDLNQKLAAIGAQAEKSSVSPDKPTPSVRKKPAGTKAGRVGGTGKLGGVGGAGGTGTGLGSGTGTGRGGSGRKATQQEAKAWRWRFDLAGDPKEHADKLERTGVIVAVPDPASRADPRNGPHLFITDLKRRPVTLAKGDFGKYADAVKWYNTKPESVQGLVRELKLPFVPPYVVLLLPKDREAKMAAEEARYAEAAGQTVSQVQETWFDFRLQNGAYEPIAIRQK